MEDEANETPASGPKPPGMNSFLDMDDDDGVGDDSTKHAHEKPGQEGRSRVKAHPPYDMSSSSNVNFSSEIIGTTVRADAFLLVPGELEDGSSESSEPSSDYKADFACSPYDGVATTDSDSEFDISCSPYDGILTLPPTSSSGTRRYGVADMAYFAQNLADTVPGEGYNLVPTISRRTGLLDLSKFAETDLILPWGPLERLEGLDDELTISSCDIGRHGSGDGPSDIDLVVVPRGAFLSDPKQRKDDMFDSLPSGSEVDFPCSPYDGIAITDSEFEFSRLPYDEPTGPNCNIGFQDSRDGPGDRSSDVATIAPHEGLTFMQRLLAELRDPNLDFNPRPLPEDSDPEYFADDHEEEASVLRLTSTSVLHPARRNSLDLTSTPGIDGDVSNEGPVYPLILSSKPSTASDVAPSVHMDRVLPAVVRRPNEEVLVMLLTPWDSPPSLPIKVYMRSHRDDRLHGPRGPQSSSYPTVFTFQLVSLLCTLVPSSAVMVCSRSCRLCSLLSFRFSADSNYRHSFARYPV